MIGCPPFSGFFSKDAILAVAYEHNLPIFAVALFTAFLTAFYMMRLLVIVFFGNPRSDSAREGTESPLVMTVPLIVLAILAALGGFGFFARNFLALPNEKEAGCLRSGAGDHRTDSRSWTRDCSLPRTRDANRSMSSCSSQVLLR